jgi:acetolactate synthase-1/2/3 large subunit
MLVITAQTAITNFGRGALQESSCTGVDTVGMFEQCTRYNTLISHIEQFERKLVAAIMRAHQSPQGPVHLSVPLDIMRTGVDLKGPSFDIQEAIRGGDVVDESAVEQLCSKLCQASRPVFLIGEGADQAIDDVMEAADAVNASVVTTPHAKGLISAYHPRNHGVFGFAGHTSADELLKDPAVDLVVAIGSTMGEWATNGWDAESLLNRRLVHVDNNEQNMLRTPMAQLHVRGRIGSVFQRLLANLEKEAGKVAPRHELLSLRSHVRIDDEDRYYDDAAPLKPQRLMALLPELFPPETRYLADSGNSLAWAIHYLHPGKSHSDRTPLPRGGLFRGSLEFASMGWAIGAAVGTALGVRSAPVVCITGDGSMLMSGQEITTAAQQGLPLVYVVLNDSAYGMVKHGQRLARAERIGFELPDIDFAAYARSLGVPGHVIHSAVDLLALDIDEICRREGPTLLDVRIDTEQVPPMRARMKVLGTDVA